MKVRNPVDRQVPAIIIVLVTALAPHAQRLPFWITGWCLLFWGYALLGWHRPLPRPGRAVKIALAASGIWAAVAYYGYLSGRDAGVAMLAVLLGVKPLEIDSLRDRIVTVFLAYFLILANLLYRQSLLMAVYLFLAVLITTAVLIQLNHPLRDPARQVRQAGLIMAQALPLMLILFLLFPRLPGGLFRLPEPAAAQSGFSDTMSPGDVSSLVLSREPVFRAEFDKAVPSASSRYWRGLVLWHFDGIRWEKRTGALGGPPTAVTGGRIGYTMLMEPSGQKWMFPLDRPVEAPRGAQLTPDSTIVLERELKRVERFRLASSVNAVLKPAEEDGGAMALELPKTGNERSKSLARQWAASLGSPEEVVGKALDFFRQNNFYYTLQPPLLGENRIDDFLFRTRKGFCEYYASSFAFLMRAAGIPSRIVLGYQGGELNPLGNYLVVRQSDAHAWVEVVLPGRGWVRVDPTAAVAPDRIELGLDAVIPEIGQGLFFSQDRLGPLYGLWRSARFRWDRMNYLWNNYVLDYTHERQKDLLARLGVQTDSFFSTFKVLAFALAGAGVLILVLAVFFTAAIRDSRMDPVAGAYRKFCRRLAKAGLPRQPHQGPQDYAFMVIRERPELENEVTAITGLYIRLRYGRGPDRGEEKALIRRVDAFRPGKKRR